MTKAAIYHNPRCSKSRQTLALLQQQNLDIDIIEYLKTPLNSSQLKKLAQLLDSTARNIIRSGEQEYKDNQLADEKLSEAQLFQAIADHPKLLQRPIVVIGDKAVIGRPPENVLTLL